MAAHDDDDLFLREIAACLDAYEPLFLSSSDSDLVETAPGVPQFQEPHPRATSESLQFVSVPSPPQSKSRGDKQSQPLHATTSVRRPKGSRNTSRDRRLLELTQLRKQVVDLEQIVEVLQLRQSQNTLAGAMWELVGKLQAQGRVRAEAENMRLRRRISSQLVVVRYLQHIMQIMNTTMAEHRLHDFTPSNASVYVDPHDAAIYDVLLEDLDAAYLRTAAVFQENGLGFEPMSPNVSKVKVLMGLMNDGAMTGENALCFQIIESETIPFPVDLVFNALWCCWERQTLSRSSAVQDCKPHRKDTVASKTQIKVRVDGKRIVLDLLYVVKAFVEQDRICCVWRGVSKTDSHFPGVYIDDTGWQVMQRTSEGPSGSSWNGTTQVTTYAQVVPKTHRLVSDSSGHEVIAKPLVSAVASMIEEDVKAATNMAVTMLLQDSGTSNT